MNNTSANMLNDKSSSQYPMQLATILSDDLDTRSLLSSTEISVSQGVANNMQLSSSFGVPSVSVSENTNTQSDVASMETSDLDINSGMTSDIITNSMEILHTIDFVSDRESLNTVGLSDIYSSEANVQTTSVDYDSSDTQESTSFMASVQGEQSSMLATPISDHLKSVTSVKVSPYVSSDSVSEIYSDMEQFSVPSLQSPSPTALNPTPVSVMSSTVAPPLPSPRPTLPSGGGNVSSTGIPVTEPSSLPLIIGLSLCGVGILIFIFILLIVCCRKRNSKKKENDKVQIQDMWVTRTDIHLTPTLDTLPTLESVTESGGNDSKLGNGHAKPIPTNIEEGQGENYKALYPYQAQEKGQLDLERDDIVMVMDRDENGWWKGRVREREGWFPGSYVKSVKPPKIEKKPSIRVDVPDEVDGTVSPAPDSAHGPAPVSTFLLSKDPERKLTSPVHREPSQLRAPVRTESRVLGKEVSIPHLPNQDVITPPPRAVTPLREHLEINGTKFKALYHYAPNFKEEIPLEVGEIVTGIVKERNGWMKGKRDRTNEVGWFPAVYVERATEEDVKAAITAQLGYENKEAVYQQLQANQSTTSDTDWIGIEHTATCPYAAENEHDLSFDIGDTIIVYERLDNGWWLGSHGDEVGWFPGAYVELIEEIQENGKRSDDLLSPSTKDSMMATYGGSNSHLSVSSFNMSRLSVEKSDDEHSISSTGTVDSKNSRRRPVRKAPPPPPSGVKSPHRDSKLPTPNQPPYRNGRTQSFSKTESTPDPKSDRNSTYTVEGKLNLSNISGNSDSIDGRIDKSQKPEIPKRYIKPKLHRISRRKINLQDAKIANRSAKSPPPPRPEFPKHIPKSPLRKNSNTSNAANESKSVDESMDQSKQVSDSDLSGVEKLDSNTSQKTDEKCENGGMLQDRTDKGLSNSKDVSQKGFSKIPMLSKQSSLNQSKITKNQTSVQEDDVDGVRISSLSEEKIHSTPKVKDVPKFQSLPETKLQTQNMSIGKEVPPSEVSIPLKNESVQGESEISITGVSDIPSSPPGRKSLSKIPQSPKQSRLPRFGKDQDRSRIPRNDRPTSPNKPPPVAPKPIRSGSHNQNYNSSIQGPNLTSGNVHSDSNFSTDFENASAVDDSGDMSSILKDDGVLITDGLDSSQNNSNLVGDSDIERNSSVPRVHSAIPTATSPQKSRSSRIPKGPGSTTKRDTSQSEIPRKNEIPKYTTQISTSSQDSNVFEDVKSPSELKEPEKVSNQSEKPVQKENARKVSGSSSRIPKGTSPVTKGKNESPSKPPLPKSSPSKGNKAKTSLPVLRPNRPPPPTSPPATSTPETSSTMTSPPVTSPPVTSSPATSPTATTPPAKMRRTISEEEEDPVRSTSKDCLKLTVHRYDAETDKELSFGEGCIIKQISEGSINDTGWFIGMLADGTTGLIHKSFVTDAS